MINSVEQQKATLLFFYFAHAALQGRKLLRQGVKHKALVILIQLSESGSLG